MLDPDDTVGEGGCDVRSSDTPEGDADAVRHAAMALLGVGMMRSSDDGTVLWMDETARRILGLSAGRSIRRVETFGTSGLTPLQRVVAQGTIVETECWLTLEGDRSAQVLLAGWRVADDGSPPMIHWTVRGEGERTAKNADAYRAIFDQVDDGIIVQDMNTGEIVDANRAAREKFKFPLARVSSLAPHETTTLDPVAADQEAYARLQAAARGERQVFEWLAHDVNGKQFWLEVSLQRGTVEEVDRIISVMRDITERKSSELALRESEERLRTIVHTTHELVWTLDLQGRFTFVNSRGEEATGHRLPDWVGLSFDPIIHPDDRAVAWDSFRQTIEGKRTRFRTQVLGAGGEVRSLMVNTAPLIERGQIVGMVGMGTDVTEQVRLEEELQRAQKLESLGVLAGGIAHDFNNILTAILGGVTLARRQAPDDALLTEMLSLSEKACLRARDLTHQLLTFSRGGAPICRPGSMGDLIRETARFVSRGSSTVCEMEIEPDLPLVDMDESQMSQVLGNIILNGVQAMPQGGTVSVAASRFDVAEESPRMPELAPGPYVQVLIRDSGVGIPPEHAAKVFDPYFTTKVHGTGLGLATSYSIVRRHGGHIDFESAPGAGTTFRIMIPATHRASKAPSEKPDSGPPQSANVLLVDDEPMLRELGTLMLQSLGYRAEAAATGEDALRRYQEAMQAGHGFDVVLMDLTIPGGMGGKDAAAELRRLDDNALIVASSGYSTDPVMADHKAFGFDAAVPKPYVPADLDAALRVALARRRGQRTSGA